MLKIIIPKHGEKGERELADALKARGLRLFELSAEGQLADGVQEAMDADVARGCCTRGAKTSGATASGGGQNSSL